MLKPITGLFAAAGFLAVAATPAIAQKPAPVNAESGLPYCSATVKDRCIQKSDLRREGKPTAAK